METVAIKRKDTCFSFPTLLLHGPLLLLVNLLSRCKHSGLLYVQQCLLYVQKLNNWLSRKKFWFIIAFAYFCGVNTSTVCNFQLQYWWNRERVLHNQCYMTIQASSRTLQYAPPTSSVLLSLPLSFPPSIPLILSISLLSIIPLSIHMYLHITDMHEAISNTHTGHSILRVSLFHLVYCSSVFWKVLDPPCNWKHSVLAQ